MGFISSPANSNLIETENAYVIHSHIGHCKDFFPDYPRSLLSSSPTMSEDYLPSTHLPGRYKEERQNKDQDIFASMLLVVSGLCKPNGL